MIAIRLDEALVKEIDIVAHAKHVNRSNIIRQAIIHFLEDQEDLMLAKQAQHSMKSTKSLKQLRDELGLEN